MTVVELKEEIKSRGLSVNGNKADLRRRLLDSQLGLESPLQGSPLKSRSTPSKLAQTPTKRENTPIHTLLTPGRKSKKAAEEESLPVTPSRRSRRLSGSLDLDTGAPTTPSRFFFLLTFKSLRLLYLPCPFLESRFLTKIFGRRVRQASLSEAPLTPSAALLTPSRRSRRLSGVEPDGLEVAPDGGVIQRNTPRRDLTGTPTGRARRHTSVKSSDVQEALNLAPVTPALPILVEEEEEVMMEAEPASTPTRRRSSKRKSQEAVTDVEMEEHLPVSPKSKKKVKTSEESSKEEEAPKKMSRSATKSRLLIIYCLSEPGGNRKCLWGHNWLFQRRMRFLLLMKLLDLLSQRYYPLILFHSNSSVMYAMPKIQLSSGMSLFIPPHPS